MRKDYYTEERIKEMGLNDRQIKAVMYVKEKGKITNKEYREITNIFRQMATIDLTDLINKDVFIKIGKAGKEIIYQLTNLSMIEGYPWHVLFILTTIYYSQMTNLICILGLIGRLVDCFYLMNWLINIFMGDINKGFLKLLLNIKIIKSELYKL